MDRSKGRIAAVMLSALACSSASKADTRALSTAGKIAITLATLVGAAEIYNEVSAVVRKKQGKELNWWNGKLSLYNLFSNSEEKKTPSEEEQTSLKKNQTFKLDENQKLVIQVMFKNVVNEGEEDDNIRRYKNFFNGEMLVADNDKAKEGLEIFKKFLAGKLSGEFVSDSCYKDGQINVKLGAAGDAKFFFVGNTKDKKLKVIYKNKLMLEEK